MMKKKKKKKKKKGIEKKCKNKTMKANENQHARLSFHGWPSAIRKIKRTRSKITSRVLSIEIDQISFEFIGFSPLVLEPIV